MTVTAQYRVIQLETAGTSGELGAGTEILNQGGAKICKRAVKRTITRMYA